MSFVFNAKKAVSAKSLPTKQNIKIFTYRKPIIWALKYLLNKVTKEYQGTPRKSFSIIEKLVSEKIEENVTRYEYFQVLSDWLL